MPGGGETESDDIFAYLVDDATVGTLKPLLLPDANTVRLYGHYPEPAVMWWKATVPLSRKGPNRHVLVQSMCFDVEMAASDFAAMIDELDAGNGGMTMVQSDRPLPPDLHPVRFRNRATLLNVLAQSGAGLLFELPHQNETAALTIFGRRNLDYLIGNKLMAPSMRRDAKGG